MSKPRKFSIPGKNNRITPNNSGLQPPLLGGFPLQAELATVNTTNSSSEHRMCSTLNSKAVLRSFNTGFPAEILGVESRKRFESRSDSVRFTSPTELVVGLFEPLPDDSTYATLRNIPDDNDDYSIIPLSEDIYNMPDYDKENRFCSATTSNMIFEENIPKNNNIWTIVRKNIVSLYKQIFQVICGKIITRNSEKYLDILSIRSPSWELYARKNKPSRTQSRCSKDKLKNYVAV